LVRGKVKPSKPARAGNTRCTAERACPRGHRGQWVAGGGQFCGSYMAMRLGMTSVAKPKFIRGIWFPLNRRSTRRRYVLRAVKGYTGRRWALSGSWQRREKLAAPKPDAEFLGIGLNRIAQRSWRPNFPYAPDTRAGRPGAHELSARRSLKPPLHCTRRLVARYSMRCGRHGA
jgi:hypothetical protein